MVESNIENLQEAWVEKSQEDIDNLLLELWDMEKTLFKESDSKINTNKPDSEIDQTYKVFPLAFHAYTEYENNISIHFLLELIREDYITLRQKLHEAINPINQVVYKISWAMKK